MAFQHSTRLVKLTQERITTLVAKHKQVLGRGATCTVYLVEVKGELCCLKLARDRRLAAMFHQEFDVLLDLDGATGAPKALGTSLGFPAMLTTFRGHNTFCDLPRLARRETDRLAAFVSLARDVQQLHARGYAHNDIKENNVAVCRAADGRLQVSLIDYGAAQRLGTRVGFVGASTRRTPWLAPELLGGGRCSRAGDVFSLGYVLSNILDTCHRYYPALDILAEAAMAANPAQRPSLKKIIKTVNKFTGQRDEAARKETFARRVRKAFSRLFPRRRRY
ncbi:serine/threonine-protein kinase PknJ-like [Eriocheir sinensis]|uniref:serine/threonine-protein kinase PknJ-like n=1 Tax=Eriocheir sinensis TaxID=95602 RepID=UPI0021C66E63|nr:serine/threonine-protein kinase PknJ-like [Eriocheir sinensis]